MSASREKRQRQSELGKELTQKQRQELQEKQAAKRKAVLYTVIGVIAAVLVVILATVGLFRFRRTLELLQATALADTLGLFLVTAGLLVLCGFTVHTVKLVLLVVILWVTNPVSSHLIARMELITGRDREPDRLTGEGEEEL